MPVTSPRGCFSTLNGCSTRCISLYSWGGCPKFRGTSVAARVKARRGGTEHAVGSHDDLRLDVPKQRHRQIQMASKDRRPGDVALGGLQGHRSEVVTSHVLHQDRHVVTNGTVELVMDFVDGPFDYVAGEVGEL